MEADIPGLLSTATGWKAGAQGGLGHALLSRGPSSWQSLWVPQPWPAPGEPAWATLISAYPAPLLLLETDLVSPRNTLSRLQP